MADNKEEPQPRFAGPGSLSRSAPEKRSWPELVGLTSEEAQRKIKEEMPGVKVQAIPSGSFVTMDFRTDRVRMFVDSSGKVEREPMIGSVSRPDPEKTSWPELVGLTSEEAERKIKEEMPGAHVQIIPSDSFVTVDFKTDRVRIFVDSSGKVEREPMIG